MTEMISIKFITFQSRMRTFGRTNIAGIAIDSVKTERASLDMCNWVKIQNFEKRWLFFHCFGVRYRLNRLRTWQSIIIPMCGCMIMDSVADKLLCKYVYSGIPNTTSSVKWCIDVDDHDKSSILNRAHVNQPLIDKEMINFPLLRVY